MKKNIFAQFDTKKLPLVNVKTYKNIDKSSYSKFIEDWQNIWESMATV